MARPGHYGLIGMKERASADRRGSRAGERTGARHHGVAWCIADRPAGSNGGMVPK